MISDEWIEKIKSQQPELRTEKLERYKEQFDIPQYDAEIITGSKKMADLLRQQQQSVRNRRKLQTG